MTRNNPSARGHMRERITQLAARLMAQDGVADYAQAKRKAARQLGADDTRNLPTNGEIEEALRAYQALYQPDEQPRRLRELREQAVQTMRLLAQFDPHLTGSVLAGTATRYSDINLLLFADDPKALELFLIDRGVRFRRTEKRFRLGETVRAVPSFILTDSGAAQIDLALFQVADMRNLPRSPTDGGLLGRARLPEVESLLAESAA